MNDRVFELVSRIREPIKNATIIITSAFGHMAEELFRAYKELEERKQLEIMLYELERETIDENECEKIDFLEKLMEICEELPDQLPDHENMDCERGAWNEAAKLAHSKALARAQAFACRMAHEKARMAMKRRKLLHAEGHFPDMACGS